MDITLRIRAAYDHFQAGNIEHAVQLCKEILTDYPDNPYILDFLGILYHQIKDYDSAIEYFRKSIQLNPNSPETFYNLGAALTQKGLFEEAVTCYRNALRLNPNFVDAFNKLAIVLHKMGRLSEAITHYRTAAKYAPSFKTFFNLAIALQENGQLDDAITCYQRVLQLNPNFADAYLNLSVVFQEKGTLDEAKSYYLKALQLTQNKSQTHFDQGGSDNVFESNPDFIKGLWAKCMSSLPIIYSDHSEIQAVRKNYLDELTKLHELIPLASPENVKNAARLIGIHKPFYLTYQGLNNRELQKIYGDMVCRIMANTYPQWADHFFMPPYSMDKPLRVGIVSGYFYYHSVWKIPMKGWIENLDKNKFNLYGYYTGNKKDKETGSSRNYFHRFVEDIYDFEKLCRTIVNDNLHVLIYPEIGMDPVTVKLAGLRLAPVQCVSWGHPETTGFPTIDYYLSGELMEPADADTHYTEKLIRLPNLSIFYTPFEFPVVDMDREAFGLRPDTVLYHCCQSLYKFLPQYDEVFPRIAKEVGNCQFLFSSFPFIGEVLEKFRSRISRAFQNFDLDANDYVVYLPLLNPAQYQALNRLSDVYLDCIGWSGCNSVLEALAENLPVVTMPGGLMRSREGAAILTMMGLKETIADTLDDYVNLSVRLARDIEWRRSIYKKITENKHLVYQDKSCIAALEDFILLAVKEKVT